MLIFVYGTLMRGYGNYEDLLKGNSTFLDEAETLPEYTLLDLGSFPGMIEGGNTAVKGELFHVEADMIPRLDRLEGHPTFYKRTKIALKDGPECETYILQAAKRLKGYPVIGSGNYKDVNLS